MGRSRARVPAISRLLGFRAVLPNYLRERSDLQVCGCAQGALHLLGFPTSQSLAYREPMNHFVAVRTKHGAVGLCVNPAVSARYDVMNGERAIQIGATSDTTEAVTLQHRRHEGQIAPNFHCTLQ